MGHLARNSRLLAAVAVALFASVGLAGAASYSDGSQLVEHWNGSAWTESNAPAPKGSSSLAAATVISSTDVWAVGTTSHHTPADLDFWSYPIAARWNGASWQTMQLPTPHRTWPYVLDAVSASAANDVWAVGSSAAGALIEHWNGKSWKLVTSPEPLGKFFTVATLSRHSVWLVGSQSGELDTHEKLLAEHWNGRVWRRVATPDPKGPVEQLFGIAAHSPRDIWAVGYTRRQHHDRPLLLHWNGHVWKQRAGPRLPQGGLLFRVAVIGANDAWAVGSVGSRSLAEHWNGQRWNVVDVPSFKGSGLSGISAVNADDIWAVGSTGSPFRTLAVHWDGTSWAVVPTTDRRGNPDSLRGVAAVATGDVWAVGSSDAP